MGRREVENLFNEHFWQSELHSGTISFMMPLTPDEYKILREAMEHYRQSFYGKWPDEEILNAALEIPAHIDPEDLNEIAQTIYVEGEESGNVISWEELIQIIEKHCIDKRENLCGLQLKWLLTRLAKNASRDGQIWYRLTGNFKIPTPDNKGGFIEAETFPKWKSLPIGVEYNVIDQFMGGSLSDIESFNIEIAHGEKSFNYVKDPMAICYILRTEDDGRIFLDNNYNVVYQF